MDEPSSQYYNYQGVSKLFKTFVMSLSELVQSEDVLFIAKRLLGATISTRLDGKFTSGIIVETEAYRAPDDKGSHAFNDLRTSRTEILFGPPGKCYVYLCYGIHHLVNVVTAPKEQAHAVLLRAIEPLDGLETMLSRRSFHEVNVNLTNGPGKMSQALGIRTSHNGIDLGCNHSEINIALLESGLPEKEILASPRVGIAYAQECANWPWRFRIKKNKWTSLPHSVSYTLNT